MDLKGQLKESRFTKNDRETVYIIYKTPIHTAQITEFFKLLIMPDDYEFVFTFVNCGLKLKRLS